MTPTQRKIAAMMTIWERDNYTETVLARNAQVPGELLLYGFTVYNSLNAAQFVQLFDDGYNVPANGHVPADTFQVAAKSTLRVYYGEAGRLCKGGVTLANSTTDTVKTAGAVNCLFDIQYARPKEDHA